MKTAAAPPRKTTKPAKMIPTRAPTEIDESELSLDWVGSGLETVTEGCFEGKGDGTRVAITEETFDTVAVKPISFCILVAKLVSSEAVIVSVNSEGELAVVELKGATRSNEAVQV